MRSTIAKCSRSATFRSAILVMLTVVTLGLTLPSTSYAQTQPITVCSSGCDYSSIAAAINSPTTANGDIISVQFSAVDYESNIEVSKNLTIEGQGVANTTINGGGLAGTTSGSVGPVFIIDSSVTATIQDMTVTNGYYNSSYGGGIVNEGILTVSNASVTGNTSNSDGGGIVNGGTLTISNATVSGNTSSASGGGIVNLYGGTITINSSTVSGNQAYYGGGILNSSGSVTITNSTFSGNQATSGNGGAIYNLSTVTISFSTIAGNISGGGIDNAGTATVDNSIIGDNTGGNCAGSALTGAGLNLATDTSCGTTDFTQVSSGTLNLGPLALNSPGTTETMALLSGSAAIDNAPNCNDASGTLVQFDQRGVSRPQPSGGACDIGAYELVPGTTATSSVSTAIDFGAPGASNDSPTGANVSMGAFVHDNATVTTTINSIPSGSTVTFSFFPTTSCGGTPSSTDTESLNGGNLSESIESTTQGPLAVGSVAYQAVFNSGDTSVPNRKGACERLNVQPPIDQFAYTLNSTSYTCTLEGIANNGGTCPAGQQEGSVGVNTTNTFVVNVEVTNLSGMPVVENVQGSLAKGKDFSYTAVRTSPGCGAALVKNNGAVLWNDSGAHSPNATGFTMNPGDVCDLYVTVSGTFTSTGQQAIASQWSVSQTETSPVSGQSVTVTSQPTGSLAVNVQ